MPKVQLSSAASFPSKYPDHDRNFGSVFSCLYKEKEEQSHLPKSYPDSHQIYTGSGELTEYGLGLTDRRVAANLSQQPQRPLPFSGTRQRVIPLFIHQISHFVQEAAVGSSKTAGIGI